jgi:hypothetical protein
MPPLLTQSGGWPPPVVLTGAAEETSAPRADAIGAGE